MLKAAEDLIKRADQGNVSKEETVILSEATRKALKHMIALNIPLTPTNFNIWFKVFLALLLKGVTVPKEEEILEVYNQLVSKDKKEEDEQVFHNIKEEVQKVLKYSGESILRSIEALEKHDKILEERESSISVAKEITELHELIEILISEIRELRKENKSLKESLQKSARRITVLKEQLKRAIERTSYDPLTHVLNRAKFEQELRRLIIKFDKTGEKFCLIMADLDNFKRINDVYGHLAGDEVLREFAYTLQKDLRINDMVCRYGGEEFAILLPGLRLKEAVNVAERLRSRVEEMVVRWGDEIIKVTASFGVAEVKEADDPESIIQRADEALYLAKLDGKNCVRSEVDVAARRGRKDEKKRSQDN